MEISGIPLHPLVVHAVVVFAPLGALLGLAYAAVPRWRWALRWPLLASAVIAVVAGFLATMSGEELAESRNLGALEAVHEHEEAGELLRNFLIVFVIAAAGAALRVGGPSPLASTKERPSSGALTLVLSGVLALASIAVLVGAFLAGHSGAEAVWKA